MEKTANIGQGTTGTSSQAVDLFKKGRFDFKKVRKILSALGNVLQVCDGAMAIFSLVMLFLPKEGQCLFEPKTNIFLKIFYLTGSCTSVNINNALN